MKPAEMSTAGICMGHGVVRHMRLRPTRHAFAYSAYFLLIPMRRLKSEGASTLAVNRAGCLSFFDADHGDGRGPDAGGALAWMEDLLAAQNIHDAGGEIWLQTYPRVWGYSFKPVSFWYCHRADGSLSAIVAEVHNTLSEDLSFRRVIRLAEEMNTAIYMMHVSAGTGVQAIREARSRGKPVYGETLHQYILHTAEDYKLPNGQMFHTYPSLKGKEDTEALWKGVSEDVIHSIATDELCCSLAVKTQGKRIDDTTGGNTGVEPRVSLMYTEMVEKRGYSLTQFVDLISSNAARILGMYPRKGAIAAGSDADLVILDPGLARTIQNKDLHESDYTPWEGHQVGVWPCLTMLRGKIMVEDGQFFGKLSDGQYLKRKIAPEILAGAKL